MKPSTAIQRRLRRLSASIVLAGALATLAVALPASAAQQSNGVGQCVSAYNLAALAADATVISGLTSTSTDVPELMNAQFRGPVCSPSDGGGTVSAS